MQTADLLPAYVFRREGGTWIEEAILTDDTDRGFASDVGLSGDVAVIGERGGNEGTGEIHVFRRANESWSPEVKLVASDAAYRDLFGWSVAVDRDVLVVGAPFEDELGTDAGAAYVYRFDGSNWIEEAKLVSADAKPSANFGISVSIEGDYAVIGAPRAGGGGPGSGAAYVFRYDESGWYQQAMLLPLGASPGDNFGHSVSIGGDYIVVGAFADDASNCSGGAAYVFERNGTTWAQRARLSPDELLSQSWFGRSVATDGMTAAIGAPIHRDLGRNAGAAFIYSEIGSCANNDVLDRCDTGGGDNVVFAYEGDVLPYEESGGWGGNVCDRGCWESVEDGHLGLHVSGNWGSHGYHRWFAESPEALPPSLWIEWRYRSNTSVECCSRAGEVVLYYGAVSEHVTLWGDYAAGGGGSIDGLSQGDFHTFRFESIDGVHYRLSANGVVFGDSYDNATPGYDYMQIRASLCTGCFPGGGEKIDEWDYVRYGTIGFGEKIIASDPPAGVLNSQAFHDLDRFTVRFDSANYVYVNEVTVGVSGGLAILPNVIQTRRRENDGPDTVEIVLDRPIPMDRTTSFTFDTGLAADCEADPPINCVKYTLTDLGPVAVCGDSAVNQATEECDGPDDTACPGACRDNCTCGFCGDGIVAPVEQCDDGPSNSDTTPDACRTNCTLPTCGDNVTDSGEECDGTSDDACPGDPETPGGLCLPDCTCDIVEIPTLSHWGLLALAILLLAVSKRHFARSTM